MVLDPILNTTRRILRCQRNIFGGIYSILNVLNILRRNIYEYSERNASMKDLQTENLNNQLKSTSTDDFASYLENLQNTPTLSEFFSSYIANHNLKTSQIIRNSGISQSYAHEILDGKKKNPSRDYLLALCLGAHMDLPTVQRALRIAQLGELYAKVPRDAAIMIHINNKNWNIIDINIFLEEHDLDVIVLSKK